MGQIVKGLKLRIGQYHFRVWSKGFEYGNRLGGRVIFFPWVKFPNIRFEQPKYVSQGFDEIGFFKRREDGTKDRFPNASEDEG